MTEPIAVAPEAWIDVTGGYALALAGGKLVCRNAKGKQLASVPKKARQTEEAEQLLALRDWLAEHARSCREQADVWMLRSLPVPRKALAAVWEDQAWQDALANVVVAPMGKGGIELDAAGFFRGADAKKGIGIVNLDGETEWLSAELVALPHPILLDDLDDWRELATELSLTQGIQQLFRETHRRKTIEKDATTIGDFSSGKFEMLNHALGKCRTLGYRVRGGFAVCPVWEGGRMLEARFWIGAEYPEAETYTGELLWVDDKERTVKLVEVGPVALSEGIRMASAIYAARVTEEEGEDD